MKRRSKQIGVGCGDIGLHEIEFVNDVLKRKRLSYGYYSKRFEKQFAKLHNQKFGIFVNSGTSALHIAIQALKEQYNWHDQDEVIVPALTFVATINVLLHNNLKPVFVDVNNLHFDLDPSLIVQKITKRTKAIMPVNVLGQPCEIDRIKKIAKKHKLKIIEDSCETMFAKYNGWPVGSRSDVSCYSTYIAHLIVTGVGGLITTNDPTLAVKMRSLANHGRDGIYISIDDDKTKNIKILKEVMEKRFNFISIGHSFRATELEAALGVAQLKRWRKIINAHKRNAAYLDQKLKPLRSYLQLPSVRNNSEHVYMVYPIVIKNPMIKRDDLTFFLEKRNIETRFLLPLLNQPIYKKLWGEKFEDNYPVSKFLSQNGFYVGCHQLITKKDLDYIVDSLFFFFKNKGLQITK